MKIKIEYKLYTPIDELYITAILECYNLYVRARQITAND